MLKVSKLQYTRAFKKDFKRLNTNSKKIAKRTFEELLAGTVANSRDLKKLSGFNNPEIWQVRLSIGYRMTFHMNGTTAVFRRVGTHRAIEVSP